MRLYCANNNTIYPSVSAAASDLGISRSGIHRFLQGGRSSAANYVFAKLNKIDTDTVKATRIWLLYSAFKIVLDCEDEPIIYKKEGE